MYAYCVWWRWGTSLIEFDMVKLLKSHDMFLGDSQEEFAFCQTWRTHVICFSFKDHIRRIFMNVANKSDKEWSKQ